MDATTDWTTLLRAFMRRTRRTSTELAQLIGLSVHTIRNWSEGKVRRPRLVTDVLALARALELDHHDTISLLRAADHVLIDFPVSDLLDRTACTAWLGWISRIRWYN